MNEEEQWREQVVAFLEANARLRTGIEDWSTQPAHSDPAAEAAYFERCRAWQRTLYDGGFAEIAGPPWKRAIYKEHEARYDVSSGFIASTIALAGAALRGHGSDAQRARYLQPLLRGDEIWCQLFSEPDAGSDLANLGTRAREDGDVFVVDGQKVWTSGAQHADFGLLLARTDPDAPKHRGITFFILDMQTEGVEVRPLRQMTGAAHFNEVFFRGARVPRAQIIGEEHHGWAVARTVLAAESAMIGNSLRFDVVGELTRLLRASGRANDPMLRQTFARVATRERILVLMRERLRADVRAGARPSVDGSVLKLLWSQAWAARAELGTRIVGAPAVANDGTDADAAYWGTQSLARFGGAIGGGTDEIQRNHVAERVLGLPPEPRTDRDRPWSETKSPIWSETKSPI